MFSVLVLLGVMISAVAAEASVEQSSNSGVEQNTHVEGGDMHVEQESSVRTETNDALVEQRAEMTADKEAGEPAQVERDTDRRVVNPNNESISTDINQELTEGEDSMTLSQQVRQAVNDDGAPVSNAEQTIGEAANADVNAVQTETESSSHTAETSDTEMNPLRQGGSFTLLMQAIDTLSDIFML